MSPLSTQLYPEVIDATTLGAKYTQPVYLPVGIEGQAAPAGTGVVGQLYKVISPSNSDTLFGASSPLGLLVKDLLNRGVGVVYATISQKTAVPSLAERQAAWAFLEESRDVRIRLTDSVLQADLVALGASCNNAHLLNNKQFGMVGLASGTLKAAFITAAQAINSSRMVLICPGVYDTDGTLKSGAFAAAAAAAEVAKNGDPADDLDTAQIPYLTDIERDAQANPLFRVKVVSGTVTNDYEDLLQGQASPLQRGRDGGVAFSHLRTTLAGPTFDGLMTRIIADQLFVLVRNYCYDQNFLRRGNTETNRGLLKSGVEEILKTNNDWIQPLDQPDGTKGYKVEITASTDERQMIVSYEGRVVRGVQTILVAPTLEIAA